MTLEKFNLCFQLVCFAATLCLISKCIHQYHLDKDNSQLEYQTFHDSKGSVYPSFSICLPEWQIFDYNKTYQASISEPRLSSHLENWDCWWFWWWGCQETWYQFLGDLFEFVDYENITVDLMEHLMTLEINLQHDGRVIWSNSNGIMELSGAFTSFRRNSSTVRRNLTKEKVDSIRDPNIYLSFKSYYEKCYSVDVPFIKDIQIRSLKLRIKGSIFRYGIRPTLDEFSVKFHYPNQQLRSSSAQRTWVSKYNISTFYEKNIYLGYINILQRRNKRTRPCHDKDYDSHVIEKAANLVGCKFGASNTLENLPFCNSSSQITTFQYEVKNQIPPCRSLISAYEWYTEYNRSNDNTNSTPLMDLIIHYPNDFYKELIYTKEYSLESLIGNIGGYIGKNELFF